MKKTIKFFLVLSAVSLLGIAREGVGPHNNFDPGLSPTYHRPQGGGGALCHSQLQRVRGCDGDATHQEWSDSLVVRVAPTQQVYGLNSRNPGGAGHVPVESVPGAFASRYQQQFMAYRSTTALPPHLVQPDFGPAAAWHKRQRQRLHGEGDKTVSPYSAQLGRVSRHVPGVHPQQHPTIASAWHDQETGLNATQVGQSQVPSVIELRGAEESIPPQETAVPIGDMVKGVSQLGLKILLLQDTLFKESLSNALGETDDAKRKAAVKELLSSKGINATDDVIDQYIAQKLRKKYEEEQEIQEKINQTRNCACVLIPVGTALLILQPLFAGWSNTSQEYAVASGVLSILNLFKNCIPHKGYEGGDLVKIHHAINSWVSCAALAMAWTYFANHDDVYRQANIGLSVGSSAISEIFLIGYFAAYYLLKLYK